MRSTMSLIGSLALISTALLSGNVWQFIALPVLVISIAYMVHYYFTHYPRGSGWMTWAWVIAGSGAVVSGFLWERVGLIIIALGLIFAMIAQWVFTTRPRKDTERASAEVGG
jgi:hypothetical protein